MQIGPKDTAIDMKNRLEQVTVVVPLDAHKHKTEHIA
jgi:hypothetical protein